jgi:glycosyltransferase involved in cell wall biosynthesis
MPDAPVTVILVVRNGAQFIRHALESVVGQTLAPREIVVVDGGSTDETREIARSFARTRIVEQGTQGIAHAYNLGIRSANEQLLAFISHDDIWEPDKLQIQSRFMLDNPSLGFTVTHVQHFLEPECKVPSGFRTELLQRPCVGMLMEALMVNKRVFETVGWFDPSFSVGEDTDWFSRARDASIPHSILPDVLVRKRVHGTNTSLTSPKTNELLLQIVKDKLSRKRR